MVGAYAFDSAINITSVSLPNTLIPIDEGAFRGTQSLREITIPASVKSIKKEAFADAMNKGLTKITFKGDCPTIQNPIETRMGPFANVKATVYYPAGNETYNSSTKLNYGGTLTWVSYDPCASGHTDVNGVCTCGAVKVCESNFPDANFRTYITNKIPGAADGWLTGAERNAVYATKAMYWSGGTVSGKVLTAKAKTVTYTYDVDGTAGDKTVEFKLVVSNYSDNIASGTCGDNLTWVLKKDGTLIITGTGAMNNYVCGNSYTENSAPWFNYKEQILSVTVGEGVTTIGGNAFFNCFYLTRVDLPDGLTDIKANAFWTCHSLETINIPDTVTTIAGGAFQECRSLTSIVIPEGVTKLGNTFGNDIKLESVTLPESLETIGDYLFNDCVSLKSITIPDNVTSIGSHTFEGCTSLTTITIPDQVTTVEACLFIDCANLESVYLPKGIAEINSAENDLGYNPKQIRMAKRYVQHWEELRKNATGLLLWGDVGTGKSFIAGCIANALLDKGVPVIMTNFARLLNKLTDMYAGDRNAYIDSFNRYQLMIIDDLGIERNSEFAREQVFSVIDSRYRSQLPMIVTTNLTVDELMDPADLARGRIYSRVLERCLPIRVSDQNIRGLNQAAVFDRATQLLNGNENKGS